MDFLSLTTVMCLSEPATPRTYPELLGETKTVSSFFPSGIGILNFSLFCFLIVLKPFSLSPAKAPIIHPQLSLFLQ